jgi:hypothetical protein
MRKSDLCWRFSNPYSTIFAAVVVATGWSLAGAPHSGAQALEQHPVTSKRDLMDQICRAIRADLKDKDYVFDGMDPLNDCQIEEITSATGDGAMTALADIGGVGASTDAVVVYRLDRGTVAAAKFKELKGLVSKGGLFLQGSSVTHSADVILSPSQHALFTKQRNGIQEDGSTETCEVHAYQWISKLEMYVERASRTSDEIRCPQ